MADPILPVSTAPPAPTITAGQVIVRPHVEHSTLDQLAQQYADRYPSEHVIVISKSARLLYFFDNGQLVNQEIRWGDYEPYFANQPYTLNISFPVPIALGIDRQGNSTSLSGPKTKSGDRRTPEGEYFLCNKRIPPATNFTVFLDVSYPNSQDAQAAFASGRISAATRDAIIRDNLNMQQNFTSGSGGFCPRTKPLGGLIGIHPQPHTEYHEVVRQEAASTGGQYVTSADWTFGCIAIENRHARFLWEEAPIGTRIFILL